MTKEQLRTLSDLVSIAHDEYDGCPSYRDDLERFDRVLAEIKAEAQSAPGNAAAAREALERIRPLVHGARVTPYIPEHRELLDGVLCIIDAALSDPAEDSAQ